MLQHLQKVVLDKGHDPVCWIFLMLDISLLRNWYRSWVDVSLPRYERRCIPEVCVLCNLCIYTRAGKEIQATSSQHFSPWTILLYWNGLQGDGFEQIYAVEDRKATTVAHCLADFIWQHGIPVKKTHDQAAEFHSDVLQETPCSDLRIDPATNFWQGSTN